MRLQKSTLKALCLFKLIPDVLRAEAFSLAYAYYSIHISIAALCFK